MDPVPTPELVALLGRVVTTGAECGELLARRLHGADRARVLAAVKLIDKAAELVEPVIRRVALECAPARPEVH